MIRCGQKTIIFLINNGGYTIEVEIHDGPYNVIKNWDYTRFVDTIHNGQGKCWTAKVSINLIMIKYGLVLINMVKFGFSSLFFFIDFLLKQNLNFIYYANCW